jgi:XisI protein
MDRLTTYRTILRDIIDTHARLLGSRPEPGIEVCAVTDDEHGQYQLLRVGWRNGERCRYTHLHVRLHGGKIWVEEDWTEEGIATDLLRAGVPASHIVLAFNPPELRADTEFAVA